MTLHWTTSEMLVNADAHSIEVDTTRTAYGDAGGSVLRELYEVDKATGLVCRRTRVLSTDSALAGFELLPTVDRCDRCMTGTPVVAVDTDGTLVCDDCLMALQLRDDVEEYL